MKLQAPRRISPFREFSVWLKQGFQAMTRNKINLFISLFFPFLAAGVTVWIAGESMFLNMESTKSACFILVCAAIWGGLFNSIQIVVKERKSVRRDYVGGALRIGCYIASRAFLQLFLCLFQSAVLCTSFWGVRWAYGNSIPSDGLFMTSAITEYFITLLLLVYAADTMGIFVSCFVKNEQLASQLSPYILIVQLLFSGVLFEMKGFASNVSAVMLSRWGMEALGSISDLNSLPLRLQLEFPMIPHIAEDGYTSSAGHLLTTWVILLLFAVVPLALGAVALRRVKNDGRG